jgi:hypothetical protein
MGLYAGAFNVTLSPSRLKSPAFYPNDNELCRANIQQDPDDKNGLMER